MPASTLVRAVPSAPRPAPALPVSQPVPRVDVHPDLCSVQLTAREIVATAATGAWLSVSVRDAARGQEVLVQTTRTGELRLTFGLDFTLPAPHAAWVVVRAHGEHNEVLASASAVGRFDPTGLGWLDVEAAPPGAGPDGTPIRVRLARGPWAERTVAWLELPPDGGAIAVPVRYAVWAVAPVGARGGRAATRATVRSVALSIA